MKRQRVPKAAGNAASQIKLPKKPQEFASKNGRSVGHPVAFKPIPETVDRVIEVFINQRPDCKAVLSDIRVEEEYQTEIPEIKTITTKFVIGIGTCPCCGNRVQGPYP